MPKDKCRVGMNNKSVNSSGGEHKSDKWRKSYRSQIRERSGIAWEGRHVDRSRQCPKETVVHQVVRPCDASNEILERARRECASD